MPRRRILCLIKHHAIKICGGVEVELHTFLTLVLDTGEWSFACPSHFTPEQRTPVPTG